MRHYRRSSNSGMTLLEVIAASTMTAVLMASTVVLVRSSFSIWEAHAADFERTENAYAVLRHVVRSVRQATAVTAISSPGDTSGNLTLLMASGETRLWSHNAGAKNTFYGVAPSTADQLLVEDVDKLTFVGYEADGVTTTTSAPDIRLVECRAVVTMPAGGGSSRTVSCKAWLRSW